MEKHKAGMGLGILHSVYVYNQVIRKGFTNKLILEQILEEVNGGVMWISGGGDSKLSEEQVPRPWGSLSEQLQGGQGDWSRVRKGKITQ